MKKIPRLKFDLDFDFISRSGSRKVKYENALIGMLEHEIKKMRKIKVTKDKSAKEVKSGTPLFCTSHLGMREFLKSKFGLVLSTPPCPHFNSIQKGFENFRSWEKEMKGSIMLDLLNSSLKGYLTRSVNALIKKQKAKE